MRANNLHGHHRRGFIALTSAVIVSAVLLVTVIGAGALHMEATLDAVSYVHVRESKNLAHACMQEALLQVAVSGTASSTLEDGACTVEIATSSEKTDIKIHASIMHSFTFVATTTPLAK